MKTKLTILIISMFVIGCANTPISETHKEKQDQACGHMGGVKEYTDWINGYCVDGKKVLWRDLSRG